MKKFFASLLLAYLMLLQAGDADAQKVDLDPMPITVAYTRLPKQPFPASYSQYSADFSANPGDLKSVGLDEKFFLNNLKVYGYEKIPQGGQFSLQLKLSDFTKGEAALKTRKETTKDPSGKEITATYYYYEAKYDHNLNLKVVTEDGKTAFTKDYLSGGRTFKSKEFSSQADVDAYIKNGKMGKDMAKADQDGLVGAMKEIHEEINTLFGYTPITITEQLQILNSRSHPDFSGFYSAYETLRQAFVTMKADQPLDSVRLLSQTAINYFAGQKDKYISDEKSDKKLRYACLYNLTLVHFWLEDLDKAAEYAQAVITNDYDPKDGKRALSAIDDLKEAFRNTGKNTRHLAMQATPTPAPDALSDAPPKTYDTDSDDRKDAYKQKSLGLSVSTVQYNGTVTGTDGIEKNVLFLAESPNSIGLSFGAGGNVRYAIDLGEKYKIEYLDKGKIAGFAFDGRIFKIMPFKSANSVNLGASKTVLELLYDSPQIKAYLAYADDKDGVMNPPEYVLYHVGKEEYTSLNSIKFALNLNKGIKKAYANCPAVLEAAEKEVFSRNAESIVKLAKMLEECKP
ncbi:MAG: hypothetical protein SFV52_03230 [Saprospiraceae bacterium]|nr:hypothetical protein [Saprospiraceae bacterium]